ncbi:MAG: short-chain dehydrogenase [Ramlibacter sp.]|nr:short-chain dehydrogenase [Ramlibacter sp.]
MERLQRRVAVITGAAGGVGAAAARAFASAGYAVVLADMSSMAELSAEIRDTGATAVCIQGDLIDHSYIVRLVADATALTGRIDVLLHNAARLSSGTAETIDEAEFDSVMSVNLKSAVLLAKHAVPVMRDAGGGVILLTTALAGERGTPNMLAYAVSKAALIHLAKCMALDHGRDGIRVIAVSPGPIEAPMMGGAAKSFGMDPSQFAATAPLGRVVQPQELGETFVFLASSAASSITGISIRIDNGLSAGRFNP